jgi:sugar lactone lactonase YvrE
MRTARWLAAGGIVLVIVATAGIAIIRPALDRASRTTELADIVSAIAVRASSDGRLVVTEGGDASGPNGRVLVIDPVTERREVVLDDMWEARDADMSSAGIVCATLAGDRGASPELRCSDGRAFALVHQESSAVPKAISPGDVAWDGESGWYVVDLANEALLHVDAAGRVTVLPTTFQIPYWSNQPGELAVTSDGRVLVALPDRGVVVGWPAMDDPEVVALETDAIVGIAVSRTGTFVLARQGNTNAGQISWCCHSGGSYRDTILDGIDGPRGLALLPDGRLAIASDGRVLLYRPDLPEAGA